MSGEEGPEPGVHVDRARGVPEPVSLGVRHRLGLFAERLQPLDRPVATDGSPLVQVTRAPEMTRERWSRTRALRRTVSPATTMAGFGASVTVVGRGEGAGGGGGGEQGESRPPRGRREPGRRRGRPSAELHRRVRRGASGRKSCQLALAWVRLRKKSRRQRAINGKVRGGAGPRAPSRGTGRAASSRSGSKTTLWRRLGRLSASRPLNRVARR